MYYHEHHAPHYHAIYGEYRALIGIRDDRVLAGRLPARARRLVMTWAGAHRAELMENWEHARNYEGNAPWATASVTRKAGAAGQRRKQSVRPKAKA